MSTGLRSKAAGFAALLFSALLPSAAAGSGSATPLNANQGVEILAHADVSAEYLTPNILRPLFTSRLERWPDGQPARVFVLADTESLHKKFCRDVLGLFPYVLRRTWDQVLFSGTGQIPETVDDVNSMRRRVLQTPGGVGYLPPKAGNPTKPVVVDGTPTTAEPPQ